VEKQILNPVFPKVRSQAASGQDAKHFLNPLFISQL